MKLENINALLIALAATHVIDNPDSAFQLIENPKDKGLFQLRYLNTSVESYLKVLADELQLPRLLPDNHDGESWMTTSQIEAQRKQKVEELKAYIYTAKLLMSSPV